MSGSSGYQSLGYSKDFPMASLQPPSSTSVEQPVPPKDCGLSTGKTTTPEAIHEPYLDDLGDKPPPPGAVEDGKTPNGQTEKATPETSKPGAETWSSPVPLYCTVNGRSHSILTDFGLNICPRCDINLLETPRRGVTDDQAGPAESADGSADESADERDDGLTDKDYNPACNCPHCNGFRLRKRFEHVPLRQQETGEEHNQQPMVAYSVEYIDREEGHIGIRPWPTTFDLDVARQGVLKYKASVFSVVTVLKTSHAPEVFRYISDDLRRDRVSRMMEDPGVTVNVHATKIVVGSQALLKALRMVVRYYPQLDLEGRSLELDEPYAVIGHHLEELESLRGDIGAEKHAPDSIPRVASEPGADDDEDLNAKAGEHLGLLLDYLHANVYKDRIPAERSLHQRNLCTFEMLWLLFKPGTTVYVEFRGNLAAHVVQSVVSDAAILSDPKQRLTPYKIRLWSLTYDGRFVGRSSTEVVLPPFGGERAITSLKVFPCEYFDKSDGGKTKRRLEENGKKWYNLLLGKQVRYRGELFDKGSLEARDSLRMRERIGPNPSKGPNREQLPPPPPPPPWIPPPMDPFMRGASREVTRQGPVCDLLTSLLPGLIRSNANLN
ncbi:uncharacterized protein PODANS_1_21540 [Podospora anserina S mat+]|uniref:Podospora anserina S mat+ genomic DNA chromosome 1, supercontig 6 n=1 Tax=Podospora anserina (strain S / ATCC MYA-4624 / DSM 980 / FGSC 10383) TaxID=515849 RepID=B2ARW9_PODAN|nr:uncharacterized protein PODANS_1_21540 [Podospora anserina S mat+]CAP67139.1 unnamed protein product [Podospora anserina S mat+]CDP24555.1 Putative protein of unknown function [Podospora anserina S mat+]